MVQESDQNLLNGHGESDKFSTVDEFQLQQPEIEATEPAEPVAALMQQIRQAQEANTVCWRRRHDQKLRIKHAARSELIRSSLAGADESHREPATTTITDRHRELQLYHSLVEKYPFLKGIQLQQLPFEVFATPDSEASYYAAQNFILSNPDATLEEFLSQAEGMNHSYTPLLERIIEAYGEYLQQQLYFLIGTSDENYKIYMREWMLSQKGERSITTDSYEIFRMMLDDVTRQNSSHQRIAHTILTSTPGTGKTEFLIKYIKEVLDKSAFIISCRPFMGFTDLVAGENLLAGDIDQKLSNLLHSFQNEKDSVVATRAIITNVLKQADKMLAQFGVELTTEEVQALRRQLYLGIGLSESAAKALAAYDNPRQLTGVPSSTSVPNLPEQVHTAFCQYLLAEQMGSIEQTSKTIEHIKGLLLFADDHNMCVILDEAEKLYDGKEPGNQTFGGIENILNMAPGSEFIHGSIKHTFSPDFFIFMTMNERKLPPHIVDRMRREIYVVDQEIDRLKIILAQTLDGEGNCVLSTETQKKLAFLVTTAWEEFQRAGEERKPYKETWSLRRLARLITTLVTQELDPNDPTTLNPKPTGVAFATAAQRVSENLPETWGRFLPLHNRPRSGLSQMRSVNTQLANVATASEADSADFLLTATRAAPTPEYPLKNWRRVLAPAEVEQLKQLLVHEQEIISAANGSLTAVVGEAISSTNSFPLSLPLAGSEFNQPMHVRIAPELGRLQEVVGENAWGNVVLVRLKDQSGQDIFAVVHTVQPSATNKECAETKLLPIQADQIKLSPDGKTVCASNQNKVTVYDATGPTGENPSPLFSIAVDEVQEITFTNNGRFLILKGPKGSASHANGTCSVYDLPTSTRFRQAELLVQEENADLEFTSFRNQLFIYDPQTEAGYCIN